MAPDLFFAHSIVLVKSSDTFDEMFIVNFRVFGFDRTDGGLLCGHCVGLGLAECRSVDSPACSAKLVGLWLCCCSTTKKCGLSTP